jgi:spore coat protein U domain-containing protein, fimbrial subunit CupE1/2/3/6
MRLSSISGRDTVTGNVKRAIRVAIAVSMTAVAASAAAVTCTVSTPGVDFGSYDVFASSATNGNGTLTISCALDPSDNGEQRANYTLTMSTGSSNSFVQRTMKSGTDALGYNLYTSNSYSIVWGDGTGSTSSLTGSVVLNNGHPSQSNTATVYGRIPALQDVAVSSNYSDNVTVTVNW